MKRLAVGTAITLSLSLAAGQGAAQGRYRGPDCKLSTGHFLVNSGVVYIKGGTEETDPVKRERMLNDAQRNLLDAFDKGQAENPAAWYYLARYYVLVDDAIGADSAFRRAEQLAPECAQDIAFYRQTMWVPLVNAGIDSMRNGRFEGAKGEFRKANALNDADNVAFFYLASIFGNEGDIDSALYYFKRVVDIGAADTSRVDNFRTSVANVAILYHMTEQWDSAAVWYRKARDMNPKDRDALLGLAEAYAGMGDEQTTMTLYDSVLAAAPDMRDVDLFDTGVKLFNADRFEMAARAFDLGLEKNPHHRDALYNLANTHLAMAQVEGVADEMRSMAAKSLEATARRLVELDPRNRSSLRLLAAAFQLQKTDDSTLAVLERVEEIDFEVIVDRSQQVEGGYTLQGSLSNVLEREINHPSISFDFLDQEGNVVGTELVPAGSLPVSGRTSFELTPSGEGIVAWRYRIAS
jgi:tetratricopeptide (TPR) repeat protein